MCQAICFFWVANEFSLLVVSWHVWRTILFSRFLPAFCDSLLAIVPCKLLSPIQYRVYPANCYKRKRHNSASRNGKSNLKTVSESPLKTIFCCLVQSLWGMTTFCWEKKKETVAFYHVLEENRWFLRVFELQINEFTQGMRKKI